MVISSATMEMSVNEKIRLGSKRILRRANNAFSSGGSEETALARRRSGWRSKINNKSYPDTNSDNNNNINLCRSMRPSLMCMIRKMSQPASRLEVAHSEWGTRLMDRDEDDASWKTHVQFFHPEPQFFVSLPPGSNVTQVREFHNNSRRPTSIHDVDSDANVNSC